uniref:Uncharacterized protein n=1 Tax=Megaselia scalaris TaxID=36166 RepID=T1GPJ3_MEGSC
MLSLKPGTFLYKTWEKPPLDVYVKVYMFNVTNHERYVQGLDDKIKVEEVGPYVYQEYLTNNDAVFNDNDTILQQSTQFEIREKNLIVTVTMIVTVTVAKLVIIEISKNRICDCDSD